MTYTERLNWTDQELGLWRNDPPPEETQIILLEEFARQMVHCIHNPTLDGLRDTVAIKLASLAFYVAEQAKKGNKGAESE